MALLDPARSDTPTATALVAALVVVHEGSALPDALEAVERQVYEAEAVYVVGGDGDARKTVDAARWAPNVAAAVAALDPGITHVWLLHDDSIPRPDTLGALVREGGRVGAHLVGSKVLAAGHPGILESVGLATDVFEVPASGLDTDELDQEQYDVLRDVAFVASSSILIARDMLERTEGPDPLLEPTTAALDLCQRVRLAGGRVVVVPSAEVLHDGTCSRESSHWRVEAGRLRAMLKAYSPITLAWVVPFSFVLDLLGAVVNLLFGRWRLFAFVRAWGWNLARLPSTIGARHRVERVAGDAELFRFQIRGSARLTRFGQNVADLFVRAAASERARSLGNFVESGGETVRRPVVASLLAGAGFALFATRQLWLDGVANAGYALAPPESVSSALQAFAGGWNPAGLGSAEPLRPVLGAVSLLQVALLGRGSLTLVVLLVAAALGGVIGVARLLGPFGIRPAARYAAGILFVGGPAVRLMAGTGVWHGIVAMAVLPWIMSVVLHRRRTASAVVAAALLTAVAAAFAPLMLVLPTIVVLVWGLAEPEGARRNLGRAAAAAVLAVPALLPWVGTLDDVAYFFTAGADFFWAPSVWVVALAVIAAGGMLMAAPPGIVRLSGWGALLMAGGAMLARAGGFGWGTDPGMAGMAAVGLGLAIIAGTGFETGARAFEAQGTTRYLRVVSALASGLLLVGVATLAVPGRLGFPSSGLTETLAFTAEANPGRALLIGDEATMPGGGRLLPGGMHYRVVSTPAPRLWEAWPSPARAGNAALADALTSALSGSSFRLGEDLAAFGIGWIVTTGSQPVIKALDAQLDLFPLALPDTRAYEVEVPAPRAIDAGGTEWTSVGSAYIGPAGGGTVRLAENADTRWGDSALSWEQDGWANQVTTGSSVIEFGPVGRLRLAAIAALIWTGVLVLAAAAIREQEPGS
ncbi:MAG: glycosyltransferase family 2 protein [Acidimicrobiia bacterium]|nr:glycosyltransferase family 2 protein [Acidimicrobiia bacterium]